MARDAGGEPGREPGRPGLLRRMGGGEAPLQGFLGEGTELSGDLKLQGSFRVDGTLKGEVRSTSVLIIGPPGRVDVRTLEAEELQVSGRVKGKIHVHRRLEVFPGGVVEGELTLDRPALVVARGGAIRGAVRMRKEAARGAASPQGESPPAGEGEGEAAGKVRPDEG